LLISREISLQYLKIRETANLLRKHEAKMGEELKAAGK
jgi:hypothetical protein